MGRKYLFLILILIIAAISAAVLYFVANNRFSGAVEVNSPPSGNVRFTDTEAGFNNDGSDYADEYVPEPIILPQIEGRPFVGWGVYWQDFSEEEARYYGNFTRPPGPLRVGIQAGHWKVDEAPEELSGLKRNGSGAQGGGTTEVVVVLEIARLTKELLEKEGVVVDLLPATIPSAYIADAFVSIHADGSNSQSVSGFKISGSRRDFSGRADALVDALYDSYGQTTGLRTDSSVTRRMSSYYAFNWRRYEHSLHPFTPAVIIETGFLTHAGDRAIIVSAPERAAQGIAGGIVNFLLK